MMVFGVFRVLQLQRKGSREIARAMKARDLCTAERKRMRMG